MVIGGNDDPFGNSPYFSTVELVSLDPASNPVPECLTNIADIPNVMGISFASVGMSSGVSHNGNLKKEYFPQHTLLIFIDGKPLLCGGQTSLTESLPSCYAYIPSNDSWIQTGTMNDPKGGSAYGELLLNN